MKISARTVQTRVWIRSSSIIAQIPFCGFQWRILPKSSGKSGFSYLAIMMPSAAATRPLGSHPSPGQLLRRLPGINPRVDLARQFEGLERTSGR